MVSGVPAIMSPTFRGHSANVSEGTLREALATEGIRANRKWFD